MTERERLIELFKNFSFKCIEPCGKQIKRYGNKITIQCEKCRNEQIVDYLLANGVIVPPCKVGTHLWKVTYPYRQAPKVTEFVVKNFRTTGKRHKIQIEVQALNVPTTNWMYYTAFYTTKEEAEQALYKINHNSLCETETYKVEK